MTDNDNTVTPVRGRAQDALSVFLGEWRAEGMSFGGTDQSGADPKANGVPWLSTHTSRWHTGGFFLIQDERALIGGTVFDTMTILGAEPDTGDHFARSFENHGFYRHYRVERDGDKWTLSGDTERATITFKDEGRTQVLVWEWKRNGAWLPLCDRTASKIE